MQLESGTVYGFRYKPVGHSNSRHVYLEFKYSTESSDGKLSLTFAGPATGYKSFRPEQITFDKPKKGRRRERDFEIVRDELFEEGVS